MKRLHRRDRRVLSLLADNNWMYGYDLFKQLPWWVGLYVTLGRLEQAGLVDAEWFPGMGSLPSRRAYRINAAGRSQIGRSDG